MANWRPELISKQIVRPEQISKIECYLEEVKGKKLGTLKEELEDEVSYGELKLVQASKML